MVLALSLRYYLYFHVGEMDASAGEDGPDDGVCLEGVNADSLGQFDDKRMDDSEALIGGTRMFQRIKFFVLSIVSILIGMKVTLKNLFSPAVTLQYPREKQPMKENFRGMVDLVPEKCVICYMCIKICPVAALDLAHKQTVEADKKKLAITKFTFNGELCCFCGLCEEICPTDAIYLNKMYEVAAFTHEEINNIDLMDKEKYKQLENNQPK